MNDRDKIRLGINTIPSNVVNNNNIVVYTCLIDENIKLNEIENKEKNINYICFTNLDNIISNSWKIKKIPEFFNGLDDYKKYKGVKILPHLFLKEFKISIWVDSSIKINGNLNDLIKSFFKNDYINLIKHPLHDCVYDEINEIIKYEKKSNDNHLIDLIKRYKKENYPINYGLVKTNIIIRNHNNTDIIQHSKYWWDEVLNYPNKDYLSFNYIAWKFNEVKINLIETKNIFNKYFYYQDLNGVIAVEIPKLDLTSGGIKRMLKLVLELPHCNITSSGGVRENLKLCENLPLDVIIRFQKIDQEYPQLENKWTVGLPDQTFPKCNICITYSDNPYLDDLVNLPQVEKTYIYMLSYGMSIERERKNVHNKNVTVLCSTKKIEKLISDENVKVHRIGFALDMDEMYIDEKIKRKKYLALLYSSSEKKRYKKAVSIANFLYDNEKIDGVITFGETNKYDDFVHPKGLIKHFPNANRNEVREIFNECSCFLMPSISEGLNLTPIESTLCGCPAIICDGAIDEIFLNTVNCFIVPSDDVIIMSQTIIKILDNLNFYSNQFQIKMKDIVKNYTWDKVIHNLKEILLYSNYQI